jgi:hypothetical protein
MPPNRSGLLAKRLAVAALMAACALSLGCGKSTTETPREKAQKSATKAYADTSIVLPDGFPKDVPIMKNATLKASLGGGDRMVVQLNTISSISEAASFYNAELKKAGWTVDSAPGTGDVVINAKKGRTVCAVTIARDAKGTLIRIAVSPAPS